MKILLALIAILSLISVSQAYTNFRYHNGDEILRQLQLLDDKTYILYIFNDPGKNRDLRTTNDLFKDRLRVEVLDPEDSPTEHIYAEVDATDVYGNGYLIDRLNIDKESLMSKPTIVVMKNGKGNVISGPTAIHSVITSIEALGSEEKTG